SDSVFQGTVSIVRNWFLPLFAVWILATAVVEIDHDQPAIQWLATAVLAVGTIAVLSLLRALVVVIRRHSREPGRQKVPELLLLLPRLIVLITAFWLLLDRVWSVDLSNLATALGVGTLVVSLALQDTLSGLASGFLLLGDRPFSPGDWIQVRDIEGRVVDVNWRSSRIETRPGDLVIVPNSELASEVITNYDEPTRLHRVDVQLQVAFSNSPTSAKEMLLASAWSVEGVLSEPAPSVRVVGVDDPLMTYSVRMWVDDYGIKPRVQSDFGSLVWYHSHRMGVPLPSPAFDLYHHDPNQEAVEAAIGPTEIAAWLAEAPLLADLPPAELEVLSVASEVETFAQGEVILTGERTDSAVFVIHQGLARVLVDDPGGNAITVVELGSGDVFGIISSSVTGLAPSVIAVTDCELVVLDGDVASSVTSRNPDVADSVTKLMSSRRQRAERISTGGAASTGLRAVEATTAPAPRFAIPDDPTS
ncbi:MAG: mechanosensitive ion channel domain-containing protein, partial [Acidimicrobiales bacterium]